jgi:hypothetical protein
MIQFITETEVFALADDNAVPIRSSPESEDPPLS